MSADNSLTSKTTTRRRVLNPKAAIIIGGAALVLMVGVRKLHSHQIDKTRTFLRESAMSALQEKDFQTAHGLLSQYLSMRSSDVEAKEQLARLLTEHVGTPLALDRAFKLHEDLLRGAAPQHDLRLAHARLAVRLQRFSDAEAHLNILQSSGPDVSEIWYLTGLVCENMRRPDEARRHYEAAIRCPTPQPEAFAALVRLQQSRFADPQVAAALMDQMVTANPSADALRIRAEWRMEQQQHSAAISDIRKALDTTPEDLRLNAMLVQCLQQLPPFDSDSTPENLAPEETRTADRKLITQSIEYFTKLTKQHPHQPLYSIDLAAALWHNGQPSTAIAALEEAIQQNPQAFVLHRAKIEYLLSRNLAIEARALLEQIPAGGFTRAERDYLTGRVLLTESQWAEAARTLDRSIAFAEAGSQIHSRAQMALAIARRNAGDSRTSVEAYKSALASDPNSITGRLGLAAAWLDTDREDLAIAEYKRLISTPGVPAYLTSLMIQRNLRQPPGLRNWDEVAGMLRDHEAMISDPVERALLQADFLFATGRISDALITLETAAVQYPDRPEFTRAIATINGELGDQILTRLQQQVAAEPENPETHAALLKIRLNRKTPELARDWCESFVDGQLEDSLSESERLRVMIDAIRQLCQADKSALHDESRAWLREAGLRFAERLIVHHPEELPGLISHLVTFTSSADTLQQIQLHSQNSAPEVAAVAYLELVRFSAIADRNDPRIAQELVALIRRHPGTLQLRTLYAEVMLYAEQYDIARQTLQQVLTADPSQTFATTRLAWIDAVQGNNPAAAAELAMDVLQHHPDDDMIRLLVSRIQLENNDPQAALNTIERTLRAYSASNAAAPAAVYVCEAAACRRLNQPEKARKAAELAVRQAKIDPLLPADARLLDSVQKEQIGFTQSSALRRAAGRQPSE